MSPIAIIFLVVFILAAVSVVYEAPAAQQTVYRRSGYAILLLLIGLLGWHDFHG
jgi:hypothetical protein